MTTKVKRQSLPPVVIGADFKGKEMLVELAKEAKVSYQEAGQTFFELIFEVFDSADEALSVPKEEVLDAFFFDFDRDYEELGEASMEKIYRLCQSLYTEVANAGHWKWTAFKEAFELTNRE